MQPANVVYVKMKLFQLEKYLVTDSAREIYEPYTANGLSIDAHIYHETWPVVINVFIQHSSTKNTVC